MRNKNGEFTSANHWGFTSKKGEIWKECPKCGDDVPERQMKRDYRTGKLVCPDCYDERPEQEEDQEVRNAGK